MSTVKVSVYPADGLSRQQHLKALIGISLGSRASQSSRRLRQLLNWAANAIGSCDFLVGDYLNRHNYIALDGSTESEALARAKQDGNEVARRLAPVIADARVSAVVIRSESLYDEPTFQPRLERFRRSYEADREFKLLIDEAIDEFLERKGMALRQDSRVREHCVAYQLEELAMFELLAETGHSVLVYGGAHLPVMRAIVSKALLGISSTLETLTLVGLTFGEESTP